MNKIYCYKCGKELDDDIIITIKDNSQKIVDVDTCCRGNCHNLLEKAIKLKGYSCGFCEMNTGMKDIYISDDFYKNNFSEYALEKYKKILNKCNNK